MTIDSTQRRPLAGQEPARLFVALWPDAATRRELVAWQSAWHWGGGASIVRPERLHITLHFLGDVPAERIAALVEALAVPVERFELRFGTAELWPHGIAVLQPLESPDPLVRLHSRLRDALHLFGWATEARPFRPHVTLARRAAGAAPPTQGQELTWCVGGHALVHSMPGRDGGYRVIARYDAGKLNRRSDP